MAKLFDYKRQVSRFISYLGRFIPYLKQEIEDSRFIPIWVIALNVLPHFIMSNMQTFLTDGVGFSVTTAAIIVNAFECFSGMFAVIGSRGVVYVTHYGIIIISSLSYFSGLLLLFFVTFRLNDKDADIIISRWLVGVGLLLVGMGKFSLTNSAHALSVRGDRKNSSQNLIKYALRTILIVVSLFKNGWYTPKNDQNGKLLHAPLQQFLYPFISMILIPFGMAVWFLCRCHKKGYLKNDSDSGDCPPDLDSSYKKLLGDKLPMCFAFLAYGLVKSIGDTFFLDQASNMRGGDKVPVQAFLFLATVSSLLAACLYKVRISVRLRKINNGKNSKYSPVIQYAMAMVLSALCCTVASWVAMSGYQHKKIKNDKISVFRLIPQFVLFGAMDGLAEEGIEQFFSEQVLQDENDPMTRAYYAKVFTQGINGAGSFVAIILVVVTMFASNWFNGGSNQLHLDQFYHLLTVVGIGIYFGYTLVAVQYSYKDVKEEIQVENGNKKKTSRRSKPIQHEDGIEEPNLDQHKMGMLDR